MEVGPSSWTMDKGHLSWPKFMVHSVKPVVIDPAQRREEALTQAQGSKSGFHFGSTLREKIIIPQVVFGSGLELMPFW